jgi:hypothetical protein
MTLPSRLLQMVIVTIFNLSRRRTAGPSDLRTKSSDSIVDCITAPKGRHNECRGSQSH